MLNRYVLKNFLLEEWQNIPWPQYHWWNYPEHAWSSAWQWPVFPDRNSKLHVRIYPNTHPDEQIQKISIPTPRMVTGNSEGIRGFNKQIFKGEVHVYWMKLSQKFQGEGIQTNYQRIICGAMDIFWIHKILENKSSHVPLKSTRVNSSSNLLSMKWLGTLCVHWNNFLIYHFPQHIDRLSAVSAIKYMQKNSRIMLFSYFIEQIYPWAACII